MTPDDGAAFRWLRLRRFIAQLVLVATALQLQGCCSDEKTVVFLEQSWAAVSSKLPWQHRRGRKPVASSLLQRSAVDSEDEIGSDDSDEDDDTKDAAANLEDEDESGNGQDAEDGSQGSKHSNDDDNALTDDDAEKDDLEPAPGQDGQSAGGAQLRGATPVVEVTTTTTHDPAAEYTALVQRHAHIQQKELNDQYEKMLYLSDPDDIDKAMKLAWMKMEYEDRKFTGAMQKRFRPKKKPRVALPQLQMLNTRVHRQDEKAANEQATEKVALADF